MKGLLGGGYTARNNEEYRAVLQKRKRMVYLIIAVGLVTMLLGVVVYVRGIEMVEDFQLGIITGFGTGLMIGGVLALIQIREKLKSEEKLKEARLKETDEREREARSKAMQATAKVMLAVLYLILIVGGIFVPDVSMVCALLIMLSILVYFIFRKYFEKTM